MPPAAWASSSTCSSSRGDRDQVAVFPSQGGVVRRLMGGPSPTHERAGYEFVYSPHITKGELFQTSGHPEWYADGMYPPMELGPGAGGRGTELLPSP